MRGIARGIAAIFGLLLCTGASWAVQAAERPIQSPQAPEILSTELEAKTPAPTLPVLQIQPVELCSSDFTCRQMCEDDCLAAFNACNSFCGMDKWCSRLCQVDYQDCMWNCAFY